MAQPDRMPRHDDPTEIEPRPSPPPPAGSAATTAQLQRDIDSGATGDKVPILDPAAAPVGTDAEAAGTPPSPQVVAATRRAEQAGSAPEPSGLGHGRGGLGARLAGGLLLAVALAALAFWFSFR